jgi:hypothetical protein
VLTILFEDHVPAADLLAALKTADLFDHMHLQGVGDAWPTLRQLIDADTRLLTFYEDKLGTAKPLPTGYQRTWDYAWDTTWAFQKPSDFDAADGSDCNRTDENGRGDENNPLFILNQMFDTPLDPPADTTNNAANFAAIVNTKDAIVTRAKKCWMKKDQVPNFIKVDHYEIGDLFGAVRKLNGLED